MRVPRHPDPRGFFFGLLAIFLFFPIGDPSWADAESEEQVEAIVWPMRIRNLSPFSVTSLGFIPSHSVNLPKGSWAMEVHLSQSNTFIMSDNVLTYLDMRNSRTPLTEEEVEIFLETCEGDPFYYDGELGLFSYGVHYGLTDQIQLFASLPVYFRGGGFLDSFIEGFHDTFGLGQAGRDRMARNINQIFLGFSDFEFVLLDADDTAGLGDPTFGLHYSLPEKYFGWNLAFETALKIPVARTERLYSTGNTDLGFQVAGTRHRGHHAWHACLSYALVGDLREDGAGAPFYDIPSATLAYQYLFSSKKTLIAQLTWSQSIFKGATNSELVDDQFQVSVGYRFRRGKTIYSAAVTENIANYDNTPDIGFHLSVYFIFGDPIKLE